MLYIGNQYDIVCQLYSNKKKNKSLSEPGMKFGFFLLNDPNLQSAVQAKWYATVFLFQDITKATRRMVFGAGEVAGKKLYKHYYSKSRRDLQFN